VGHGSCRTSVKLSCRARKEREREIFDYHGCGGNDLAGGETCATAAAWRWWRLGDGTADEGACEEEDEVVVGRSRTRELP
jgi:hypothetical protein